MCSILSDDVASLGLGNCSSKDGSSSGNEVAVRSWCFLTVQSGKLNKAFGGMKKISINLKIIHLWPFRHTNKYYKHLDLYQCQAREGALPASCCLSVSWCTFIQVIFKLGKGKKPCCGRLVALTTSNMHYLQSQLHFLHLHTLILACANVWVFDFCNFSALIMCVFACWEEPLYLYLKLEGVQAKTSANNYLPVVFWKQKISLSSASCPLFIFPVVLHKQILFIFHSVLCASILIFNWVTDYQWTNL